MKLFAVLDVKAGFFNPPFPAESTIEAIRGFTVSVNDPKTTWNRFPDDFALMEFGEFVRQSGEFKLLPAPLNLATARSLIDVDRGLSKGAIDMDAVRSRAMS